MVKENTEYEFRLFDDAYTLMLCVLTRQ